MRAAAARRSRSRDADLWRGPPPDAGPRRDQPADRRRRVRRGRRPERLRKVVAAETGVRAAAGDLRQHHRRPARGRCADQDRRHGVPESEPAAVANGAPQRHAAGGDRAAAPLALAPRAWRLHRPGALAASDGRTAEFEQRLPWQLSGGMQQRASLCRALMHEPTLLLLDEPFGALDAFTREELWSVLQALWMEKRFTVILVTHDLREALFLSDTIYVMSARPGRILVRHEVEFPPPAHARQHIRAGLRRRARGTAQPHLGSAQQRDARMSRLSRKRRRRRSARGWKGGSA